jgi:hypothetical protein
MANEEICANIIKTIAGMHPGPHAILYVIRIGRYTQEEHSAYRLLKSLFDDSVFKHMILLFTRGDLLGHVRGAQASSVMAKMILDGGSTELQEIFSECGQRAMVFDNMATDKETQVKYLLEQVRSMLARNGGYPYHCPKYAFIGRTLEEEVNRRVRKIKVEDSKTQQYIQQLEREKKSAEDRVQETSKLIQKWEDKWAKFETEERFIRTAIIPNLQEQMREQAKLPIMQQDNLRRILKEKEDTIRMLLEGGKVMTENMVQREQKM